MAFMPLILMRLCFALYCPRRSDSIESLGSNNQLSLKKETELINSQFLNSVVAYSFVLALLHVLIEGYFSQINKE